MQHGSQPPAARFVPESLSDTEDCDDCLRVLTALERFGQVRAVKAYRLRVDLTPPVPHLPCLDHEAMLHEGIAPHAAAYVEDRDSGELHEIVLTPSKRRIEIDLASTLHEHTLAGQVRLLERVARAISGIQLSSQYRVLVARRSTGGAGRVARRPRSRFVRC